jgi:hypothetical protein
MKFSHVLFGLPFFLVGLLLGYILLSPRNMVDPVKNDDLIDSGVSEESIHDADILDTQNSCPIDCFACEEVCK